MLTPTSHVAILGFGKRATAFAGLLAPRGCSMRAWDSLLAAVDGAACRARIEAAGVDAVPDLGAALRGARLVVVDTLPPGLLASTPLHSAQRLLDLGTAPVAEVEAVLVALGVPPAAADWEGACASTPERDPTVEPAVVRRGELP